MKDSDRQILQKAANTIRGLSMDGIEAAGCGHPGLPLGCAEIAACLYGAELRHNPANPDWLGRDRFVLSAGHGSMLLYASLHLAGYELSLDDLKNFRQKHSPTPGHPEYREAPGVETTTGPLGQGVATAAGMALGNKMLAAQTGTEDEKLLDGQVFVLAGDGCMMEGISAEAASLAGHLQLDNLIVIYDSNDICLDGPTTECFTEDTKARFKAYGWHVVVIDGHDLDQIEKAVRAARRRKGSPSLIIAKTVIGKGSPNMAGTSKAHGAALGADEVKLTKEALGISPNEFDVPADVKAYLDARLPKLKRMESSWNRNVKKWAEANPEKATLWQALVEKTMPADIEEQILAVETKEGGAGRVASQAVLQKLHEAVPCVVGGSADLSCSDSTMMKADGVVEPGSYAARNIKYGVREFAMGAMSSGLALHGAFLPFCGTFLTFSDYMRNAIRLAALMRLHVVYQFTHDSVLLGEDGPTHQPIEHVASMRAMPNLTVIRPGDANEVKAAWCVALQADGPVALILSRQGLPDLEQTNVAPADGVGRGAYVIKAEPQPEVDFCILASGSEVALALDVAAAQEAAGKSVRVVSVPSFELFDAQDAAYRDSVLGGSVGQYWSIEAGSPMGWHKYIGRDGHTVAMETFGMSAPQKDLEDHFGFTVEKIVARMNGAA